MYPTPKAILKSDGLLDRPHPLSWVIELTGYSKQSIYRLMAAGEFPKPISLGARKVAWMESDVLSWLNSRVQASKVAA